MKFWPLILLSFVLLIAAAYSQETFYAKCDHEFCMIKRADLISLLNLIVTLNSKVEEMEGRGTCS